MFRILPSFFTVGLLASSMAFASEKTCAVKGMHCKGCAESVAGKVCGDGKTYEKCDVKILDEKNEIGQVHLVTKEAAAKIDEKELGKLLKGAGYTLDKCVASAPTDAASKKLDGKKAKEIVVPN